MKLLCNLFIASVVFTFFITVLTILLNPQVSVGGKEFLQLYMNLYFFYGPLSFVFIWMIFFVLQFFAEKKYPIGIFNPPTITYFLSFTVLVITFLFYLNYDYYLSFFSVSTKTIFIRILLINLTLIIAGVVFAVFKKVNKKWIQIVFLILLVFNLIHSYSVVIYNNQPYIHDPISVAEELKTDKTTEKEIKRIKLVIMEGLSLKMIYQLSSGQKLLNFNEILNKGASARINCYKPNMSLSLLNTALTGLKPSDFSVHSVSRYKFPELDLEFDIIPRYILFRKLSSLNVASFFNKSEHHVLDYINRRYEQKGCRTIHYVCPHSPPIYGEKALRRNSRFIPLFPDLLNEEDQKYELLKKSFFYDDYLMNCMRRHWQDPRVDYSIVRFPGLGVVSKYFAQYQDPEIGGGDITETDLKKYKGLVEKYYEYYDSIIGNLLSTTSENEMLVIMSFYEYEPLPVWRRILLNLFDQKDVYVYRSLSSQGTVLFYEKNALKKDFPLKTISIYDIYPTLLYYSGHQLPKQLEGEVVREIFTDEFILNNPIDIDTDYSW